jgi:hypothetical protein
MGRPVTNPNGDYDRLLYKLRIIPQQLDRAYRRVEQLEREAMSLGLGHHVKKRK